MFKVFHFLQGLIKSCNVFTSPVNLRYKLQPDYNTFAGGVVSIALILLLMSIFSSSWMALLNKSDISSNKQVVRQIDPIPIIVNSDDFMFAIGVSGLNLTDNSQKKYFKLKITKTEIVNSPVAKKNTTPFSLEPCTEAHWEQLGSQFVDTFKRQGMNSYLCVPRNTKMEFAGKFTSEKFTYYRIGFDKCVGQSDCRTQTQIDAWVAANTSFSFNFYYSNTLLNPEQKQPFSMFFQDKDYMTFTPSLATSTNLYLGEYIMQTDESIFPWQQQNIQHGFIINRGQKESFNYIPNPSDSYCKLFLRKSNSKIQIQRKFRKLDDMLSYIGGLFGIIAVFFSFAMKYYGQCCFQLEMCQNVFNYQSNKRKPQNLSQKSQSPSQNQCPSPFSPFESNIQSHQQTNPTNQSQEIIEPKDFGFLDFIVHFILYVPLKKIFNINWRRMQIYEESLQEMRYKLDISQLMEKLTFYDRSINALFDENQLKLLYLQQKFNFQEVRDERNMLSLRKDVLDNLFGMIVQTLPPPPAEQNPAIEKKKTLKQIAFQRSHKRIQTYIGRPAMNLFDILAQAQKSKEEQDVNIPPDIKTALKDLDEKIQNGDVVSTRIYNGLQYELLQAFEKSKKVKKYEGKTKKIRKPRASIKQDVKEEEKKKITFADLMITRSQKSQYRIKV